jgi:NAD dependent epimerase/dehydratase
LTTGWAGKRVLITGAGGFIGSHLTEELVRAGATTRALVHYNSLGSRGWLDESDLSSDIEFVAGNIEDASLVRTVVSDIDVVFHLAALIGIPYSYVAPASYLKTNAEGTLNVLQAAREFEVERVVQTSTSETYGTAAYVPIDETHPAQPQSPYAASKVAADALTMSFHAAFQVPAVIVRPFNTFGPRQSARAVIPTIISQFTAGRSAHLGNLLPTRDFTYVSDTVCGFLKAAKGTSALGEAINLGTGNEISIGDLVDEIGSIMGVPSRVEIEDARLRPAGSEVDRLLSSNDKAGKLIGWAPKVSLKDGLSRTIDWIKDNEEKYRVDSYEV